MECECVRYLKIGSYGITGLKDSQDYDIKHICEIEIKDHIHSGNKIIYKGNVHLRFYSRKNRWEVSLENMLLEEKILFDAINKELAKQKYRCNKKFFNVTIGKILEAMNEKR